MHNYSVSIFLTDKQDTCHIIGVFLHEQQKGRLMPSADRSQLMTCINKNRGTTRFRSFAFYTLWRRVVGRGTDCYYRKNIIQFYFLTYSNSVRILLTLYFTDKQRAYRVKTQLSWRCEAFQNYTVKIHKDCLLTEDFLRNLWIFIYKEDTELQF